MSELIPFPTREHLRLYQHVHLDHGHGNPEHEATWPVTERQLTLAHQHDHRVNLFRFCAPHLIDEIPLRSLDATLAEEDPGTVGS